MSPSELTADLRRRINPKYVNQIGTESHERQMCLDVIEGLLNENKMLWKEREEPVQQAALYMSECNRLERERDAAVKLAAERLEQMNADRKQYLDLRDKLAKPFAYYDPSSGQFAIDKSDLPIGAQVWPLF